MGEHIRIDIQRAQNLPAICADMSMIEQVVMNLCVNARDAMREGGTLTLRTFLLPVGAEDTARHPDAREGLFVCLSVIDNRCGMDAVTMSRIFEPFFTTKGLARGRAWGFPPCTGSSGSMKAGSRCPVRAGTARIPCDVAGLEDMEVPQMAMRRGP
jgi:signal transduction histidine kinase